MLSDLSYSYSEDSSYENLTKNVKSQSVLKKKSTNNGLSNANRKTCEVYN